MSRKRSSFKFYHLFQHKHQQQQQQQLQPVLTVVDFKIYAIVTFGEVVLAHWRDRCYRVVLQFFSPFDRKSKVPTRNYLEGVGDGEWWRIEVMGCSVCFQLGPQRGGDIFAESTVRVMCSFVGVVGVRLLKVTLVCHFRELKR